MLVAPAGVTYLLSAGHDLVVPGQLRLNLLFDLDELHVLLVSVVVLRKSSRLNI